MLLAVFVPTKVCVPFDSFDGFGLFHKVNTICIVSMFAQALTCLLHHKLLCLVNMLVYTALQNVYSMSLVVVFSHLGPLRLFRHFPAAVIRTGRDGDLSYFSISLRFQVWRSQWATRGCRSRLEPRRTPPVVAHLLVKQEGWDCSLLSAVIKVPVGRRRRSAICLGCWSADTVAGSSSCCRLAISWGNNSWPCTIIK